ncbi:MAG: lamin tail domain-containing protein [Bacteroidales bacterium]
MKKIIVLSLLPLYLPVTTQAQGGCEGSPAMGTLVICEIMADPVPSYGLPEKEYLEITNRDGASLSTAGVMLICGPDTAYLSPETIAPGESIILCSTGNRAVFLPYGRVMAVKSFPTLNNEGEVIALRDSCGRLIHAVSYTPRFLGDGPKSDGGWSAEMTDKSSPFNEPWAWSPSSDPSGGTPGKANSADIRTVDTSCPQVLAVWSESPLTVTVLFDETVMIGSDVTWMTNGTGTLPVLSGDPADRKVLIPLRTEIGPGVIITLLIAPTVTDFAGNRPCVSDLRTGIPTDPVPGDIMFNELLPDPVSGCDEYIELYNNSGRIIDLSGLSAAGGYGAAAPAFTALPRQLLPGEYVALTTDRQSVLDHFPCASPGAVLEADRLPALNDDSGMLLLYDRAFNVIDRVDYSSSMHLMFLSVTEGVALEKVSPSLPSDVAGNWHSASESCGWGTPGAPNSGTVTPAEAAGGMTLSSTRVSPDGDGFEDIVSVGVFPGGVGNIITVTVFNDRGYPVRRLAERNAAGAGAQFIWDGTSDSGARLPAGLYMILAESFSAAGSSRRWKEVCAILYR